ncbi:glycosyltransferase family 2 protein [Heyndrickxia ginsengihumi]|uniref:glycosyltransferase family 2 protein n=1 Tax=Heyndrickxia ginsengihumi TaxID=363870 RepID=UPI00203FB961|nr:glycosyltransferase family 2 protein [Heyndrickxia ginsengihumi]MCM3023154.1 glycosyltransferase [Heyndrickxia ginsengihumi]
MFHFKPLVSVVIPTYNRGHLIETTINSVLNQTYKNFELIVVDDASTDNTESIVNSINDERIRYIRLDKNTKGKRPRNVGINLSKGEYIAFLDSDDLWLPRKLEKQLEFIYSTGMEKADIMCFTGLIIKNHFKEVYHKNKPYNNENIMEYILVGRNEVQTSTYMISSSIAKKTLFDETLKKHQDWDFCLRLKKNHTTFLCLPDCLTVWNIDNNDRITNSYKNEQVSLDWLISKESELTIKSQWAFKAIILVDNLIERKKKREAVKISFVAFFNKSISFSLLLKNCSKIVIPKNFHNKIKYLVSKI